MKGLFIPEITAEMFRNGCLESIEQLMAEGEIYDIEYSLEQQPCDDYVDKKELLKNIEVALDATNMNDEYTIGLRNGMRVVKSFVDCKRPDYEKVSHLKKQEPCEDCISREALLAKIDAERKHLLELKMDGAEHIVVHHARRIIEDLPPVTPQPKIGEWLEKEVIDNAIEEWQSARCSVCDKYHTTPYMYYFSKYKFCPNCGARMEVGE